MKTSLKDYEKTFLWRGFFLFSGIMFLIFWSFILNLTPYFNATISPDFFIYLTFTFSSANILSFLTSKFIFKRVQVEKMIFFSISICCISFTFMSILIEISSSTQFQELVSVLLVALSGYCTGLFQGKISGMASSCGAISLSFMNIGTGLAGFGSNLIVILFAFIFPSNKQEHRLRNLKSQMIIYLVLLNLILAFYILVLYRFLRKFGNIIRAMNNPENEDAGSSNQDRLIEQQGNRSRLNWSFKYILRKVVDLFLGMIFNYSFTIQIVCFFIPELIKKYEDGKELLLLLMYFIFNLTDTCGKMIPPRFYLKNSILLHILSLLRVIFQIYFTLMLVTTPHNFLSHILFRIFVFIILGILNGYFTNNYFYFSASRFNKNEHKDMAGFLIVFALDIGIFFGTFIAVLWTI